MYANELKCNDSSVSIYAIFQILSSDLWHARETALKLLQVIVFSNLFVLQEHNKNIENIVIDKLSDPHVEVILM